MPSDDKGGPHFVAVEESSMRRLVVALTVLALALSLVACGGGEPAAETAAPATGAADADAAAAGGAATTLPEIANRSENETDTFAPFPTGSTIPPDLMY
jgi:ABC-type phosphate transport system substrate-binding protein